MNNYNDFPITKVSKDELFVILKEKHEAGYRLSQICAVAYEGYNEVLYSVNLGYDMENYKIELPIDEEIQSVSDLYPAASLYENELKELWGVQVVGMAIDYNNSFYLIEEETPFKKQITVKQKEDK